MTFKEIATMIGSIGLPYAYYQFPEANAVTGPPFVCFYYPHDNDFKADSTNYQKIEHLVVELYTDEKDFAKEATVEGVLAGSDMVWSRSETWIDSEQMHLTVYEMDVVITEETSTEELNNG